MYSLLYLLIFVFGTIDADLNEGKKNYDGHSVWKAIPNDDNGLKYLQDLYTNGSGFMKLDFWHPPSKVGHAVDIMINPDTLSIFKLECKLRNIELSQFITNVQSLIDAEKPSNKTNLRFKPMQDSRSFDSSKYLKLEEIEAYIKALPSKYPGYIEWQYIATTHEYRKVLIVKITNRYTNSPSRSKSGIWLDAGIHAREWIAPATALYTINKLLSNYNSTDSRTSTKSYVDNLVWYIVPVMNPDGYAYTFSRDRMWRKNRRPRQCSASSCCEGVDLNRNFGFHWAESGSSPNSCTEVYHGPQAFSEPESKGVRDYIMTVKDSLKAYLTLHSYSLMWIYPYGYKPLTYPNDKNDLVKLANKATNALRSLYGTVYTVGSAPDILYSAAGGSDDWAKGVANVKYVYTIELRPGDNGFTNGFILPANQIQPTGEETWISFKTIADEVLLNYPSEPIDETVIATTAKSVDAENSFTTSADDILCEDLNHWCKYWALLNRCSVTTISSQCKLACKLCDK